MRGIYIFAKAKKEMDGGQFARNRTIALRYTSLQYLPMNSRWRTKRPTVTRKTSVATINANTYGVSISRSVVIISDVWLNSRERC